MSQKKKAQIATIVVLACVVGVVIVKRWRPATAARSVVKEETAPQDVIYAMLDAARQGDVSKYIASYTGQMETSLRQAIAESPDFGKYLKDSNAAIKGVAIADPQQISDREVKAREGVEVGLHGSSGVLGPTKRRWISMGLADVAVVQQRGVAVDIPKIPRVKSLAHDSQRGSLPGAQGLAAVEGRPGGRDDVVQRGGVLEVRLE